MERQPSAAHVGRFRAREVAIRVVGSRANPASRMRKQRKARRQRAGAEPRSASSSCEGGGDYIDETTRSPARGAASTSPPGAHPSVGGGFALRASRARWRAAPPSAVPAPLGAAGRASPRGAGPTSPTTSSALFLAVGAEGARARARDALRSPVCARAAPTARFRSGVRARRPRRGLVAPRLLPGLVPDARRAPRARPAPLRSTPKRGPASLPIGRARRRRSEYLPPGRGRTALLSARRRRRRRGRRAAFRRC